ncbi:nucleolar RNA-binding protein [Strigomonas culicis]|uniref:Nucleolar RNA-binding protein n=1 Tax=Strigomonas culicis TaxID=28005 RepID=S9UTP2_9TRYP|nr:nucleolar RNA-binding protein [Strigomonas culicis]|eukprot:EPY17921.1 nucleolar RNA-binding protein [Strigomonas culicis]
METFFGLEVVCGRPQTKLQIPKDSVLHVTQIAIPSGASGISTLKVATGGKTFVIATLDTKRSVYHSNVDMLFTALQDVAFVVEGSASVHLTGYVEPMPDSLLDMDDDEEEEEEEEEEEGQDDEDVEA